MRLQIVSDLHLGHELHFRDTLTIPEASAPILIIAGDIWEAGLEFTHQTKWMDKVADRFEHVVFVSGNHDFYTRDINEMDDKYRELSAKLSNVHYLQNSSVEIGGIKFVGATLWTDFMADRGHYHYELSLNDYYSLSDASQILEDKKLIRPHTILERHKQSVDYLFSNIDSDTVVVTHHGPSYRGMSLKWAPKYEGQKTINHLFFSNLDSVIERCNGPRLWVYGHTHDSGDFAIGDTRLVCNPRGYVSAYGVENNNFDWNFVVDI